ncbi:MAG: ATP synthase subunit I [Eubacteriaceae bacterium]|nr:ATP synthase subunit I [Eubacteriaceae bacterium]
MKMKMTNLSLETTIMVGGGVVSLVLMPFGFITANPETYILGILFGGLYSILNFKLMQVTFDKAIKMPPVQAQKYIQTRYFLRYLISGVVIYVAIINPWLNIIGVILGLIAIKISVLMSTVLFKKNVSGNEA